MRTGTGTGKGNEAATDGIAGVMAGTVGERRGTWSKRDQRRFFERLATTGDVEAAARFVGRSVLGAMAKRRGDGGFRDQWDVAIREARDHVRTQLLAHVLNARGAGAGDPDFDVDRAFRLIGLRHDGPGVVTPAKGRDDVMTDAVSIERLEQVLLRKLRALQRRRQRRQRRDVAR